MSASAEALEAKGRGNTHFKAKEWDEAIAEYSEAIALCPGGDSSHTFFSNRSACFAAKGEFRSALEDAEKCIELRADFAKGYSRKGLALFKLGKMTDAKEAYEAGLEVAPADAGLKAALEQTEAEMERREKARSAGGPPRGGGGGGLGGLFGPDIWSKIHAHPELREFAKDEGFKAKVTMLQSNPQLAISSGLLQDPQIAKLFEVVLGLKMGGPPPGADDEAGDTEMPTEDSSTGAKFGDGAEDTDSEDEDGDVTIVDGSSSKEAVVEDEKEAEERRAAEEAERKEREALAAEALEKRREELKRQKEAEAAKQEGNEFYKAHDWDKAIVAYKRAQEIDPKNPAYLLNESAVLFMMKEWDATIAKCEEAVALCRKVYADLKWTHKAFVRMGSVEEKRKNLPQAVAYYKKALVEKKDDKLKKRVKQLIAKSKRKEEAAYLDPELALEHKAKGNDFFKAGKWEDALREYTESIRRNPRDPAVWSNRATTYCKLMGWEAALDDCKKCLALDDKYIKAWIRRGKIYHVLKQYHQSIKAYTKAAAIDKHNPDLVKAMADTQRAIAERNASGEDDPLARARALEDPDVKRAMNDPEVSTVLSQASSGDSSIVFRAMRDRPHIAEKIQLLIAAGVLSMR